MRPLQIWIPTIGRSLGFPDTARDVARAFFQWNGEATVWFLPGLDRPVRWAEAMYGVLAIPAERFECAYVYHIGENGYAFGVGAKGRFPPEARVDDRFLDGWLNSEGCTESFPLPRNVALEIPQFEAGKPIGYQRGTFELEPRITPLVLAGPDANIKPLNWPIPGWPTPMIFPEAESCGYVGPLRFDEYDGQLVAVAERDPGFRLLQGAGAPNEPLQELFPLGIGLDELCNQARMKNVCRRSATDPDGARWEALRLSLPYISEGVSSQEFIWFWPTYAAVGLGGLQKAVELAPRHRVRGIKVPAESYRNHFLRDAERVDEIIGSEAWHGFLKSSVPVRRAWGGIGFLWALLLDRLERQQPYSVCKRCQRILVGRRKRQLCGRDDDLDCFNKRRAEDVRRSERRRASTA